MTPSRSILTLALIGLFNPSAHAGLGMSAVFSDGAVLQCQQALPVWGWGEPGSAVSVKFSGQTEATHIQADGTWSGTLKPIEPA